MSLDLKLTIITSTYNCLDNLIKNYSVSPLFNRDRRKVEWIVVDGGSSDGTTEFLFGLGDLVDVLIVEPDHGIYDAWNKGLGFARGEFITFLGSDDTITENYLSSIYTLSYTIYNVLCFKTGFVNNDIVSEVVHEDCYRKPWNYPVNLGFFHTGTLFHKSLFEDSRFDISFRFAGDQDHLTVLSNLLEIYFYESEDILVYFQLGGVSNSGNSMMRLHERLRLYRKHIDKSFLFLVWIFFVRFQILIKCFKKLANVT